MTPRILVGAALLLAAASLHAATTTATLLLAAKTAQPGDTVWAGVLLKMAPGWHTYWVNPGESGLATTLTWKLPTGVTAGAIQWPPPEVDITAGLTTYVYRGEAMLLMPLKLAPNLKPGPLNLRANVSWLECSQDCVPASQDVQADLAVADKTTASAAAGLIDSWRKRLPVRNPALGVKAAWEGPAQGDQAKLAISGSVVKGFTPNDFLSYPSDEYAVQPKVASLPGGSGHWKLEKSVQRMGKTFPQKLTGILVQAASNGPPQAFAVALTPGAVPGATPGQTTVQSATSQPPAAPTVSGSTGNTAAKASLLGMLGLAFLGGLILNVMPCVLPVIALKILGFVQQSKEEPRRVRQLGIVYASGVTTSFLVLAGVVIGVQRAGGAANWGMQMQNPYFRLVMLGVVTLVALNLFGLFEVTLGGGALGAATQLASREGSAGAFFNGVLATALATPCTAPFLTIALGFAFTQSPAVIVLMFVATALGMASPYVLLSWNPGWLRFLPKPGRWMQRFKVAMGFPMLAVAIWLYVLTAPSFGEGGRLWLGLLLVLLGVVVWVWGEFVQRGTHGKPLAIGVCVALLALAYGYVMEDQLDWRHPHPARMAAVVQDQPGGILWHRWSAAAVEKARAEGHPVLVDFTAGWCLTCQANKRVAIEVPAVQAKLKSLNAVAFRADFTDRDPRITAALRRHGRTGVPLVLVYPSQTNRPALVLPTVLYLDPGIVLKTLNRLGS